jgi:hypothetical protein
LDGTSRILLVLAAIVDRIRDRAHPLHTLLFGGINPAAAREMGSRYRRRASSCYSSGGEP